MKQRSIERHYSVAGLLALLLLLSLVAALVFVFDDSLLPDDSLLLDDSLVDVFSLLAPSSATTVALLVLRLSVTYQPEPLKTMPTGWKTRRTAPAQE